MSKTDLSSASPPQDGSGEPAGSAAHPGPWTWEEHELSEGFSCIVYDARGNRVMTDHEGRETAAMIAASPTMLTALEEIEFIFDGKEDIDSNGGPNDAMKALTAVRAALAKARAQRSGPSLSPTSKAPEGEAHQDTGGDQQ